MTRSGLSATFTYDAASRVTQVDYGNGAKILRHYDNADRLQWIEHRDASNNLLLRIDYAWNTDDTVRTRTEQNVVTGQTAVVTFAYDRRDRLIGETRVVNGTTTVYDITYTYDPLGNRLQKRDYAAGRKTDYYYDSVEQNRDPNWRTNDNRLLWYVESADNGQGGWTALRTVRYTYYETGHVSNITIKDEWTGGGTPPDAYNYYHDLALYYTSAGKLWRVLWDQWLLNGPDEPLAAREFYYDGPRQRYLVRDVNPTTWEATGSQHWTDYAGGLGVSPDSALPYGDFDQQFSQYPSFTLTEQMRYLGEFGPHAQQAAASGDTIYLHGDLIRSTMATTDGLAQPTGTLAYTAFGEPIGDPALLGTRYQYGGGWGFESGLIGLAGANLNLAPVRLQHIGGRWHDPRVGRSVQRPYIRSVVGLGQHVRARFPRRPGGLFQIAPEQGARTPWEEGDMWEPWVDEGNEADEKLNESLMRHKGWRYYDRPHTCPYCFPGPCGGHFEAAPPQPPPPPEPEGGGLPAVPVIMSTGLLSALAAWRQRRTRAVTA